MDCSIAISTGTAGSGKTQHLLNQYRNALRQAHQTLSPGTTLWLTPTNRSRKEILNSLLNDALPACFAPNIYTFDGFAEAILQSSDQNIFPISDVMKRRLLKSIISELIEQERLNHFGSIAHTSGFLNLVSAFISELKREEIWPEHFERACSDRGNSEKDSELTLIYQHYQSHLLAANYYDSEGRFWSARTLLAGGQLGPFSELSLIIADGFTDFTKTQYEILALLSDISPQTLISLPLESPLKRQELFAKSEIALKTIKKFSSATVTETNHTPSNQSPMNFAEQISETLFANPREVQPLSGSEGIEILSVTGQHNEVKILAKRVKVLLIAGINPSEIVIAFRSVDEYADQIHETFTAAEIPYYCEAGMQLSQCRILCALIAVLQMELEDWSFDQLLKVLDSNYFCPDWEELADGETIRKTAAFLRRKKLHSDRKLILKLSEREADWQEKQKSVSPDHSENQFSNGFALLKRLDSVTERLRRKADFETWVQHILAIARELGIAPSMEDADLDQLDSKDRQIWTVFEGVLFEAVKMEQIFEQTHTQKIALDEFFSQLLDLLQNEHLKPSGTDRGKVSILSAAQVRNLDIPYLFLAGLSENSFPAGQSEDCLYTNSERRELIDRGLDLTHLSSRQQDEMLLFYGIVTRARKSLVLSYSAVSRDGQPLFPSPYLAALASLFDAETLKLTSSGQLDPVPAIEDVLTETDFRTVATAEIHQQNPELFRSLLEYPNTAQVAENLLAAIDVDAARFETSGMTCYEGSLEQPANLSWLKEHFSVEFQFSATQLEKYAKCGFSLFSSDLLHLEALETPEAVTDHRKRGLLVHDVLAALLTDETEFTQEELTSQFHQLVKKHLGFRPAESELQKALLDVERQLMEQWGTDYALDWKNYHSLFSANWDIAPVTEKVEVAFGNAPVSNDDVSKENFPSLNFGDGVRTAKVRGRIDRIDIGTVDSETVFNVIDYKTGQTPRFDEIDVSTGRSLQLALYTLAVKRLGIAGPDAVPYQMGYWSLKKTGFVQGIKTRKRKLEPINRAVWESLEEMLEQIVPDLAMGIRSGQFLVYNTEKTCTQLCEYSTICRVNQIRPIQETLQKFPHQSDQNSPTEN